MNVLKSLCLAFSTYTRIPMPSISVEKANMKYILCFLPLVGAVIGGLFLLWYRICDNTGLSSVCFAAAAAALPVLVTGGIHADGYIDTNDALSSYGSKQKILQILSDPHVGAFGIIAAIVYFLLYFGFLNEIPANVVWITGFGFVLSRAMCSVQIVFTKPAKDTGMLCELKSAADKTAAVCVPAIFILACAASMIFVNVFAGILVLVCQTVFVLYETNCVVKRIGGITGDTCGHFIMLSELVTLIAAVLGGILV